MQKGGSCTPCATNCVFVSERPRTECTAHLQLGVSTFDGQASLPASGGAEDDQGLTPYDDPFCVSAPPRFRGEVSTGIGMNHRVHGVHRDPTRGHRAKFWLRGLFPNSVLSVLSVV